MGLGGGLGGVWHNLWTARVSLSLLNFNCMGGVPESKGENPQEHCKPISLFKRPTSLTT